MIEELAPSDEVPTQVRVTPHGIKLAFFHRHERRKPFRITVPFEQWKQIVRTIEELPSGVTGFEAFFGFTPATLHLHDIDAVEANLGNAR